ncbi:MAG TPA: CHAT domain-containing tetratricopeptide repeat protein, partial [Thermoanaerobaculia bacterium]
YRKAARLWGEVGDESRQAWALNWLGMLYTSDPAHRRESAEVLSRALGLFRHLQDERQEAIILSHLGNVRKEMGDYEQAGRCQEQALVLWEKLGNNLSEQAARLNDLAIIRVHEGRTIAAIDLYSRAAEVWRVRGEWEKLATTLTNLGIIYDLLGESRMALDQYRRALALLDRHPESPQRAIALNKLGDVLLGLEGPQSALAQYQKALKLRRRNNDRRGQAVTLNSMGLAQLAANHPAEALQEFNAALEIFRREGDRLAQATVLNNLGLVYERLGYPGRAREPYENALALADRISALQRETSLFGLAHVARAEGKLAEAELRMEQSLAIVETIRDRVGRPDLQASYQAARQERYGFLIDLLAERHRREPGSGYDAKAFAVSERARARSLLDLLSRARHPLKDEELSHLDDLSRRINVRHLEMLGAASRGIPSNDQGNRELTDLLESFRQAKAVAQEARPTERDSPPTVPLAQVQARFLGEETLLLEYFLGEERSFLWAVTSRDVRFVTNLPGRSQVEAAARQTYERMTESHHQTEAVASTQAAAKLSAMILGPVADLLGRRRLVIVAPGALQAVPFAALPHPAAGDPKRPAEPRPLILDHEIVSLPSATVLAALRSRLASRRPPRGLLAVIADPVMGPDDERLPNHRAAVANRRTPQLRRLPSTGGEAATILALAGSEPVLAASGFAASRELVRSGRLKSYRILHFATHGLLNDLYPELSSLALSAFDPSGRPVDGQLRAYEVADLDLRASLVVLSACRTALGEEVRGEGLVGLAQGFFRAGAPRLVVSLWDVNDTATRDLMKVFYTALLREKLSPAQALRKAQIALFQHDRWHAPYYWAGFVLQGEWK